MAGSRDIPSNAATRMAVAALKAVNAVKIEWGGGTGDEWYSDADRTIDGVTMDGKIIEWGEPLSGLHVSGEWSFVLEDADDAVKDALSAEGTGKKVTLYQIFDDAAGDWLTQSDWVVLWVGVLEEKSRWDERDARIELTCVDYGHSMKNAVCHVVNDVDFPYASPSAFGQALPVVYGDKLGVPAMCVQGGGPRAELTTALTMSGTTFCVDNAEGFPASDAVSPIDLWVGKELLTGYFGTGTDSNLFTITDRNVTYHTGTLTFAADSYNELTLDTTDATGYWEGFAIRFRIATDWDPTVYDSHYQYRTIRKYEYEGAVATAWLDTAFSDGPPWVVDENEAVSGYHPWKPTDHEATALSFEIVSHKTFHARGTVARYAGDRSVVFVISDRAASDVPRVAAVRTDGRLETLPAGTYSLNLDDNQFASELGANCCTVTFRLPPEYLRWGGSYADMMLTGPAGVLSTRRVSYRRKGTGEIVARVQGPTDAGDLIEHPADVIDHLAQRCGLAAGDIDSASVTAAKAAKADYKVSFALTRVGMTPREAVDGLARLCECAVDWTQGTLRLVALTNEIAQGDYGDADVEVGTDRRLDSEEVEKAGLQAVVTRYLGQFEDRFGEYRETEITDDAAVAVSGLLERTLDAWPYEHRNPVDAACSFWLYRERYAPDVCVAEVYLDHLDALPGDVVDYGTDRSWIEEIRLHPGARDDVDRISLVMRVPISGWYDDAWVYPSADYTTPYEPTSVEYEADAVSLFYPPRPSPAAEEKVGDPDYKVKVTVNDTTANHLYDKLAAGDGIGITELNDGADEGVQVAHDGTLLVSVNDTTPGYLYGKLTAGSGITVTETNDGGNESVQIASTAADEKAKVTSNDTTAGYLLTKLVAGDNITLTEVNDGSDEDLRIAASTGDDEKVKVSSNDTTANYLLLKVVGGDDITISETGDGGDEDLTIDADNQRTKTTQLTVHTCTSDPGSPAAGDIWLRTDL